MNAIDYAPCIKCRSIWKQVMEITANQRTGFTDEMRMRIAWDISPSPNLKTPWSFGQRFICAAPCEHSVSQYYKFECLEQNSKNNELSFQHISRSNKISWSYWSSCISRAQRLKSSSTTDYVNSAHCLWDALISQSLWSQTSESALDTEPWQHKPLLKSLTVTHNSRGAQSQAILRLWRGIINLSLLIHNPINLSMYLSI